MKKARFTPLQIAVHILGWLPLGITVFDGFMNNLSVNPIQDIEQRLGRYALYFLIASLACTPLNTLFGWREMIKRRRALGLYAFMYAAMHVTFFVGVDYGFDLGEILRQVVEKPYILMGLTAACILLPLAITSFQWFKKKMGRGWQSLHRMVYLAGIVVIIHYAWSKKGDLFSLSGDIVRPLLLGLLVAILLIFRIPVVRQRVAGLRQRVGAFRRLTPVPKADASR
jgi:sulfoxide reductase heme-binding subunit YedZ